MRIIGLQEWFIFLKEIKSDSCNKFQGHRKIRNYPGYNQFEKIIFARGGISY